MTPEFLTVTPNLVGTDMIAVARSTAMSSASQISH